MAFPKYQTKEVLNKVLNAGEDALKIDIDNVTLDGSQLSVDIDNENDSIVIFSNTAADGSGTNTVPLVDAAGHLQVDVLTTTANDSIVTLGDTAYTEATSKGTAIGGVRNDSLSTLADTENEWSPLQVNASGALYVDGSDATQPVSGTVSVSGLLADGHAVTIDNTDSNEVYVRGSGTAGSADAKVLTVQGIASGTALAVTESSPISGFATSANQSTIIGHVDGVETLLGTIDSDTDAIKTAVELIDDTVAVLGTATYSEETTKGNVVGAVRNDDLAALAGTDNEIAPLQVNASGALYTTEASGQAGSIFVADTSAITSKISGTVFTAIQFIEDTVFNSGNAGLISATNQLYPSSQYECTDIDDDGFVVDGVTFPQGMTIFGRWTGFTLVSGKVIAYIGYV